MLTQMQGNWSKMVKIGGQKLWKLVVKIVKIGGQNGKQKVNIFRKKIL